VLARRRRIGDLRRFGRPVRVIFGARDRYLNPRVARNFAALFPNSELHLLDGAGHSGVAVRGAVRYGRYHLYGERTSLLSRLGVSRANSRSERSPTGTRSGRLRRSIRSAISLAICSAEGARR
jgi:hypothetical protein